VLTRRLLALIGLLLITVVVAGSGLAHWLWGKTAGLAEPVQRRLASAAPMPDPPREELAALRAEVAALRRRLDEAAELRGTAAQPAPGVVVARGQVISRTQRAARRYLDLDVGTADGVMTGMAVCAGRSLVGVVAGVADTRCTVQQLGDAESRIAGALIAADPPRTLGEGVLAGAGRSGDLALLLVEDRDGLDIPLGTAVVTVAGLGRVPAGLVLGEVTAAQRPGRGDAANRTALSPDHWSLRVRPLRPAETCSHLAVVDAPPRR
jgi:cell shape-determining protein MreC